jgi:hypothetical protein
MQLFLRRSLQIQNRDTRDGRGKRGDGGDCAQREHLNVQRKGVCILEHFQNCLQKLSIVQYFVFFDILALSEF